jgi:hypothetical protein
MAAISKPNHPIGGSFGVRACPLLVFVLARVLF